MKRVKLLFIVQCLLLVCLSQYSVAQVSVKAEIDSVQILIGSQAQLSIEVVAPEQSLVQMPAYQPRSYLTKGVEIVEVFPLDTIQQSDRTITLQQRLSITAFDEHLYPIPAQHIRVNNKDYKTNALALKVMTLDVDTLHPEKFFPPKPLQRNPWWWSDLLPACCCWLVALIFALAWAYANRLYSSRLSFLKQWLRRKPLPPHVVALKALGDIRNMSLSAPLFYSQITEILRRYLAARFHVNAMEMTTREILRAVQQTDELLFQDICEMTQLCELLERADLAKFAQSGTTAAEQQAHFDYVAHLVETTKPTEEQEAHSRQQEPQTKTERRLLQALMLLFFAGVMTSLTYLVLSLIELIY